MDFLGPVSGGIEKIILMPVVISLLVMYHDLFLHELVYIPERVRKYFKYMWFRLLSVFIIALTVTSDVEYALISTLIFVILLNVLKTPEERKKTSLI
jgi:hypothetical protein